MQSSERRIICQRAHWRIELHMCPKDSYAKLEFVGQAKLVVAAV